MPPPRSAGILLFRQSEGRPEVLLIKPGGPFWKNKDVGAWMIPKGMIERGEAPAEAALREFEEETGTRLTAVPFPLATVRQAARQAGRGLRGGGRPRSDGNRIERVRGRMAAQKRSDQALSPRSPKRDG